MSFLPSFHLSENLLMAVRRTRARALAELLRKTRKYRVFFSSGQETFVNIQSTGPKKKKLPWFSCVFEDLCMPK